MPNNKAIGAQAPGYAAESKSAGGSTTVTAYGDMTNDQLREELTKRGLQTGGNKDDLVQRLEDHDSSN